ncbi:MAG: ABC transporter ATP-binding protein [Micrococcales bacterium]
MPKPVLDIQNLQVAFATDKGTVNAVKGVNLQVQPGEILAVVGESGSGKSVTARSVLELLPETAVTKGAIYLNGADVLKMNPEQLRTVRGKAAAMVFQEPSTALNPVYPVGWQIIEGLRAHTPKGEKFDKAAARRRAIEILGQVGIPNPEERVDYFPHQFSGGQKQRVVIACALVLEPKLILADEPTTALDVTVQAEILDLLRACRDNLGASVLIITHNMGVVADLADRVAVMYQGQLIEQAPVVELFDKPREDYTKRLLAAVPRIGQRPANAVVASSAPVAVSAEGLEVTYPGRLGAPGHRAVDGVSFEIREGEVLGLVGESGSGKTTIGRAMVGLAKATGGSLRVLGVSAVRSKAKAFKSISREVGFVFQDPASSFNPQLSIGAAIAEPMLVHGILKSVDAARPAVEKLLSDVQLPIDYFDRFPHELSGGQRQRASLARALALRPKLVIADEPTSALDVSVQARVLELFAELQKEYGFACLFITHDLAVVDQVASRVMVMHRGKIVEHGPTRDVLTTPKDDYTKRLVASSPIADPVTQRARRRNNS